ncbi:MAG TPA: tetratricopeptide repeat protein, partial [Gemmataceae bacterium]|nr:tetratricopeptide repeat protein [Gemmataceae bacterium]
GSVLLAQRRYGEAEAALRKALDLKPRWAEAQCTLGNALSGQGKHAEAEAAYRKAIDLKPDFAEAHANLGNALDRQGRPGEAEAASRKAIDLKPGLGEAYYNLGNALNAQGKRREAESAFRKAIDLKPDYAAAYYHLGNALMDQQRHGEAEAAFRKTIDLKPDFAEAYTNLGSALVRQKRPGQAEAALRKAIGLNPGLYEAYQNLGIALMQQSQFDESAAALKKASELLPAKDPRHALVRRLQQQRQRYATLDARLPAVLRGTEKPANAVEQIEFAGLCVLKKRYAAAARLYDDALTTIPQSIEVTRNGLRYHAACAAARAGCGRGEDGDELDDGERARWREQARQWLRADLAAWTKALDADTAKAGELVRRMLTHWRGDPDLEGLREPGALDRLPAEERKEWSALWSEVDALLNRTTGP